MTKLPRNLSGTQLIKALEQLGYQPIRQTGSHVRLTSLQPAPLPNPLPMPSPQSSDGTTSHLTKLSKNDSKVIGYPASGRGGEREKQLLIPAGEGASESLRELRVNEHHLTVPLHDPLRIGTLAAILADVAARHAITREALIAKLFGK